MEASKRVGQVIRASCASQLRFVWPLDAPELESSLLLLDNQRIDFEALTGWPLRFNSLLEPSLSRTRKCASTSGAGLQEPLSFRNRTQLVDPAQIFMLMPGQKFKSAFKMHFSWRN